MMQATLSGNLESSLKKQRLGIKNIDLLLPIGLKRNSNLLIENGLIAAIDEQNTDGFIDGLGMLVTPGLINSHTHTAMNFLRDLAHDTDDVISNLFFKTEKQLTEELVEKLSYSFMLSALRSGTSTIVDHYYFCTGVAKAAQRLGLRAFVGETIGDLGGAFPEEKAIEKISKQINEWNFSSIIKPVVAPHAIDTVSDKLGADLGSFAQKNKLPIHFHISQRKSEFDNALKTHGASPVELAQKRAWLGENSLAVHLLYLGQKDLDILKSTNTTVVNCPSSQVIYEKLAPIEEYYKKEIPLAVGTDCNASSDQADIISELKTFTLFLKDRGIKNITAYKDCFAAITSIPAKALSFNGGKIELGCVADLAFIKQDLENLPLRDIYTHIIFSIQSSHVQHVMIDGKWALWNRDLVNANKKELESEYSQALSKIKL